MSDRASEQAAHAAGPDQQRDGADSGPSAHPHKTDSALADTFDAALAQGNLNAARRLIHDAEMDTDLPRWWFSLAKARIAQTDGDLEAATAILVMAIEAEPHAQALRRSMTEVLLAKGSAGHARDVLAHLGQPPTEYALDGTPVPAGTRDRA